MKRIKKLAALSLLPLAIGLTACGHNPALSVPPDALAKAINGFEELSIGNTYAASCGIMAATEDPELKRPDAKADCGRYFKRLATYLNQQREFQGITENDIASTATWRQYFKSRHAHGRGDWTKTIGINP